MSGSRLVPAEDFPLLARTLDGQPLTYLDSAATSLRPRQVLDAERQFSEQQGANVHRGKHALSEEASFLFETSRRKVAAHLNASPSEIIFTQGTTDAINLVAHGLDLGPAPVILCTGGEHHSNLVPWLHRAGTPVVLDVDPLTPLSPEVLAQAMEKHRPALVALGHASNVTGIVQPLKSLLKVVRDYKALSVVDAAQSVPHLSLDVQDLDCDFLAFSFHKCLGPTGLGVLYGKEAVLERVRPFRVGGGMVDRVTRNGFTLKGLPWRLEAGTPHITGVIGAAAALDYLQSVGFEAMHAHEERMAKALVDGALRLPGLRVLHGPPGSRLALVSLVPLSKDISADQLAVALSDGPKIMVRSGFHCAHPLFDKLDFPRGALRASAYLYNTVEEVERFVSKLGELMRKLGA